MTNPKIEKAKEEIAKKKKVILTQQMKLRELERQFVNLENAEIVARFREGMMTEDDLAAARQKAARATPEALAVAQVHVSPENEITR
jgi:hypothetical protein